MEHQNVKKFFLIENEVVPWGDWGEVIFFGFLLELNNEFFLERIAETMRPIYEISNNLVINLDIKEKLIYEKIFSSDDFIQAHLKKIISLGIKPSDYSKEISDIIDVEDFYEPEMIIEKHDGDQLLINKLNSIFIIKINHSINIEVSNSSFIVSKDEVIKDIHIYKTKGYMGILVSNLFKEIIEKYYPHNLCFKQISMV